jgi:uncharacterized protein (DUF433 family)
MGDEDELIRRYIVPDADRPRPDAARLKDSGTHVWAIIGHWYAVGQQAEYVADDYGIPQEAVEAALAYYDRHRALIDARLRMNAVRIA